VDRGAAGSSLGGTSKSLGKTTGVSLEHTGECTTQYVGFSFGHEVSTSNTTGTSLWADRRVYNTICWL